MENGLDALRSLIGQTTADSPSPLGRWLNGTLKEVDENGIKIAYVVRAEMTNPVGILHGGMVATMLDDIMGMTIMVKYSSDLSGYFFSTVNLHIDYLASAREGATVIASSNITKAGSKIMNAEGWLHDSNGKLLAHSTSNLLKVEIRA